MLSPILNPILRAILGSRVGGAFSPVSMFGSGEQGWVYDLADFSTLFQDSAGTIPGAVGQPVGLVLDKSKGLVLGNELLTNGDFSGGAASWTLAAGFTASAGKLTISASSGTAQNTSYLAVAGSVNQRTIVVDSISGGSIFFALATGDNTIISAPGTYTITGAASTNNYVTVGVNAGTVTAVIDLVSVKRLPGNHAYQSTTGKRPLLQQDGNGKYYLKGDGIDDFMQTSSINFTGTDKLSVWAGVRKLDDATFRVVSELSVDAIANNGAFFIAAPFSAGVAEYTTHTRGTAGGSITKSGHAAPITNVLSYTASITPSSVSLKVSPNAPITSASSLGTGNFGNYPMYFMSRAGTSRFNNGHLYSSVCLGRAATAEELAKTEAWVAEKTGVTL